MGSCTSVRQKPDNFGPAFVGDPLEFAKLRLWQEHKFPREIADLVVFLAKRLPDAPRVRGRWQHPQISGAFSPKLLTKDQSCVLFLAIGQIECVKFKTGQRRWLRDVPLVWPNQDVVELENGDFVVATVRYGVKLLIIDRLTGAYKPHQIELANLGLGSNIRLLQLQTLESTGEHWCFAVSWAWDSPRSQTWSVSLTSGQKIQSCISTERFGGEAWESAGANYYFLGSQCTRLTSQGLDLVQLEGVETDPKFPGKFVSETRYAEVDRKQGRLSLLSQHEDDVFRPFQRIDLGSYVAALDWPIMHFANDNTGSYIIAFVQLEPIRRLVRIDTKKQSITSQLLDFVPDHVQQIGEHICLTTSIGDETMRVDLERIDELSPSSTYRIPAGHTSFVSERALVVQGGTHSTVIF